MVSQSLKCVLIRKRDEPGSILLILARQLYPCCWNRDCSQADLYLDLSGQCRYGCSVSSDIATSVGIFEIEPRDHRFYREALLFRGNLRRPLVQNRPLYHAMSSHDYNSRTARGVHSMYPTLIQNTKHHPLSKQAATKPWLPLRRTRRMPILTTIPVAPGGTTRMMPRAATRIKQQMRLQKILVQFTKKRPRIL